MAEITKDSIQNGIFQDGQLVFGSVSGDDSCIYLTGPGAFAHGSTTRSKSYIYASGYGAIAQGHIGGAESYIKASGAGSLAQGAIYKGNGSYISANCESGIAIGNIEQYGSNSASYIVTNGNGMSIAIGSIVGGNSNITANGEGAIAIGAIGEEEREIAVNNASIYASGKGSIAAGYIATDNQTIKATKDGAVALGIAPLEATGDGAVAMGIGTIANKEAMTAIGKYNKSGEDGDLFVVGDGNYGTRSNAFKVNSNNNTVSIAIGDQITLQSYKSDDGQKFGEIQSTGDLTISGKNLNIQSDDSEIIIDGYHGIYINNCNSINVNGAEVHSSGGFYDESDIRKKDILSNISLEKSYELLDKCQEIIYTLKEDPNKKEQVGMIAQEVEEFFPEIVSTDNNGFKSLDYARLSVICLRLIKDIVEQIKELKNEIKNLKN